MRCKTHHSVLFNQAPIFVMEVCDVNFNVVFGPILIFPLPDCKVAFISFDKLFLLVTVKCEGSVGRVRENVYRMCYMSSRKRCAMVPLTIFALRGCGIPSDEGKYTIVITINLNTITIIPYVEKIARGFCGCWHADDLRFRHFGNSKL